MGVSSCSPCMCIPTEDTPFLVLCQGRHINTFPDLQISVKQYVESIHVFDTFIQHLPNVTFQTFPSLNYFEESKNPILECDDIREWELQHPHATFVTDCPDEPNSTTTGSITSDNDWNLTSEPTTIDSFTTDFPLSTNSVDNERDDKLKYVMWYGALVLILSATIVPFLFIIPRRFCLKVCQMCKKNRLCKLYGNLNLCKKCGPIHQANVINEFQYHASSNWCPCLDNQCQICSLFTRIIMSDDTDDFSLSEINENDTYSEINCIENVLYDRSFEHANNNNDAMPPPPPALPSLNPVNPFNGDSGPHLDWEEVEAFELGSMNSGLECVSDESQVSVLALAGSEDEEGGGD